MLAIYRGYNIDNHSGSVAHPIRVLKDGTVVYVCKTEHEAYTFIDRSKRELTQAETSK